MADGIVQIAEEFAGGQIVVISSDAVDQFAEEALLDHIEHHHLPAAVATVFQHHEGGLGGFVGIDQVETILQGVGAADLDGGVFPGQERFLGDGGMAGPIGHNDHGINGFVLQNVVVIGG